MNRHLIRWVAVLVIPCLVGDPVTASAFSPNRLTLVAPIRTPTQISNRFNEEAFATRPLFRLSARPVSVVASMTGLVLSWAASAHAATAPETHLHVWSSYWPWIIGGAFLSAIGFLYFLLDRWAKGPIDNMPVALQKRVLQHQKEHIDSIAAGRPRDLNAFEAFFTGRWRLAGRMVFVAIKRMFSVRAIIQSVEQVAKVARSAGLEPPLPLSNAERSAMARYMRDKVDLDAATEWAKTLDPAAFRRMLVLARVLYENQDLDWGEQSRGGILLYMKAIDAEKNDPHYPDYLLPFDRYFTFYLTSLGPRVGEEKAKQILQRVSELYSGTTGQPDAPVIPLQDLLPILEGYRQAGKSEGEIMGMITFKGFGNNAPESMFYLLQLIRSAEASRDKFAHITARLLPGKILITQQEPTVEQSAGQKATPAAGRPRQLGSEHYYISAEDVEHIKQSSLEKFAAAKDQSIANLYAIVYTLLVDRNRKLSVLLWELREFISDPDVKKVQASVAEQVTRISNLDLREPVQELFLLALLGSGRPPAQVTPTTPWLSESRVNAVRKFIKNYPDLNYSGAVLFETNEGLLGYMIFRSHGFKDELIDTTPEDKQFDENFRTRPFLSLLKFGWIQMEAITPLVLRNDQDRHTYEALDRSIRINFSSGGLDTFRAGSSLCAWKVVARTPELEKEFTDLIQSRLDVLKRGAQEQTIDQPAVGQPGESDRGGTSTPTEAPSIQELYKTLHERLEKVAPAHFMTQLVREFKSKLEQPWVRPILEELAQMSEEQLRALKKDKDKVKKFVARIQQGAASRQGALDQAA